MKWFWRLTAVGVVGAAVLHEEAFARIISSVTNTFRAATRLGG